MGRKPKVLLVPAGYPTDAAPMKALFFKEQAEGLSDYVDVSVLYVHFEAFTTIFDGSAKNPGQNAEKRVEHKVPTVVKCMPNLSFKSDWLYQFWYNRLLFQGFAEICQRYGTPDIIHALVSYPAGYGGYLLSKRYGIPLMVTEHASFIEGSALKRPQKIAQVFQHAAEYMAVSESMRQVVRKMGRAQCEVVPNFIDYRRFATGDGKPSQDTGRFDIVNVSLMKKVKGIPLLLEAFRSLRQEMPEKTLHLHLVGGGPELDEYKKRAVELGVGEAVTFYGIRPNQEVPHFLHMADFLVIPSEVETFCIAGVEAMAAGKPVVSTDCGGPREYIRPFNGLLVENRNPEALQAGMRTMIERYAEYDPKVITQFIKDNYSKEAVCGKLVQIYEKYLR